LAAGAADIIAAPARTRSIFDIRVISHPFPVFTDVYFNPRAMRMNSSPEPNSSFSHGLRGISQLMCRNLSVPKEKGEGCSVK
jgi:hypothetical protein